MRFLGDLKLKKLFDGQAVTEIVGHRAQVVHAVGHGNDLLIKLRLAGLLDAGVQITNLGIEPDNDLAVDLQHQPEHAMGGRMLRAHVQHHVLIFGAFGYRDFAGSASYGVSHQRYPSTG